MALFGGRAQIGFIGAQKGVGDTYHLEERKICVQHVVEVDLRVLPCVIHSAFFAHRPVGNFRGRNAFAIFVQALEKLPAEKDKQFSIANA